MEQTSKPRILRDERQRFYADLNPGFPSRNEKRYAIFDVNTRWVVARSIAPQYANRKSAERCAERMNAMEREAEERFDNPSVVADAEAFAADRAFEARR
jgi:hypothetical protein